MSNASPVRAGHCGEQFLGMFRRVGAELRYLAVRIGQAVRSLFSILIDRIFTVPRKLYFFISKHIGRFAYEPEIEKLKAEIETLRNQNPSQQPAVVVGEATPSKLGYPAAVVHIPINGRGGYISSPASGVQRQPRTAEVENDLHQQIKTADSLVQEINAMRCPEGSHCDCSNH